MEVGSPRLLLPMAALLNAVDTVEGSNRLMPENPTHEAQTPEPPVFWAATGESETPAPNQAAPPPTVESAVHQDASSTAEAPAAAPMEIDETQGKPVRASSSSAKAQKAQHKDEPPAPAKRASRRTRQPSAKMQSPSPPPPKRTKTAPASRTPSVDRRSSLQSIAAVDTAPPAKPARGARKRRSTAEAPAPAPPLAPTPAAAPASKSTRAKTSTPASLKRSHSAAALADTSLTPSLRICELCKQVNNICASFHCSSCRRVYHAQCFAQSLAPYYDKTQRIELQMGALRLSAPSQQVSMLRCNSCKAAFIEFTRGGYKWDCDCITCKQPEKLLGYRSFTLLEMMREMAEERKQKKKGSGAKAAGKAPAAASATAASDSKKKANPRRAAAPVGTRQSRRVAAQETVEPDADGEVAAADEAQVAVEEAEDPEDKPTIMIEMSAEEDNDDEVVEVDEHGVEAAVSMKAEKSLHEVEAVDESEEEDIVVEREAVTSEEPEREHEGTPPAASKKSPSSFVVIKPKKLPIKAKKYRADEDSGLEAVVSRTDTKKFNADINVKVEDHYHHFRVTCTENPDSQSTGIMKEGMYIWHYKDPPKVKCECCQSVFSSSARFVNHTNDALLKEPTSKSATDFLFVQHNRNGKLSPLLPFIKFLRENVKLPPAGSKPKSKTAQKTTTKNVKRPSKKATDSPVQDEALSRALESERLNNVEFVRVKRAGLKSSDETFGIRVICMDREESFELGDCYCIENPSAETTIKRARKSGYLLFNTTGKANYSGVFCDCCNQFLSVDDFVLHTGLEEWDRKFKVKYLFVENSSDATMLYELAAFWTTLEQLKFKNLLAVYLKKRVRKTIEK